MCTIVVPHDLMRTSTIDPVTHNIFDDYATLHPAMIGMSNAWYNNWVVSKELRDDLKITFEALKNNVESNLWSKALEDHEEFSPIQQGGPLMLYFVLKRILDVSESSIDYL